MIIEHELLEQIADEPIDWSLARALEFVAGHKEPWTVIVGLYRDGCVNLHDHAGEPLPMWRIATLFRQRDLALGRDVFVRITPVGENRIL